MRSCSPSSSTFAMTLCAALGATLSASAQADLYNVHFRAANVVAAAGEVATVSIGVANQPLRVTGFSFGVKHDATKLSIEAIDLGSALTQALGAGTQPDERFFVIDRNPVGGAGFTVAMILSAEQAAVALPAGPDNPVLDVKYRLAVGATGAAKVDITGDLSNANRKVDIILDANGVAKKPVGAPGLTSATVTVQTGPAQFVRGDANQSNRLEVTDATLLIDYLFGGGQLPAGENSRLNCLNALNFDGSTAKGVNPNAEEAADIDLSDVVSLLGYLFRRGAEPPAPFPRCGQPGVPAAADMACKAFICR